VITRTALSHRQRRLKISVRINCCRSVLGFNQREIAGAVAV
jgi:hypothetical protein